MTIIQPVAAVIRAPQAPHAAISQGALGIGGLASRGGWRERFCNAGQKLQGYVWAPKSPRGSDKVSPVNGRYTVAVFPLANGGAGLPKLAAKRFAAFPAVNYVSKGSRCRHDKGDTWRNGKGQHVSYLNDTQTRVTCRHV